MEASRVRAVSRPSVWRRMQTAVLCVDIVAQLRRIFTAASLGTRGAGAGSFAERGADRPRWPAETRPAGAWEDRGQRTQDGGQRTEDRGQRTEDRGQRTEDRGQRTEDRGQRQRTEDRGQRTQDGGQRTEDRGQRTEDRGQRTEDRGQRTEDTRSRRTHGGMCNVHRGGGEIVGRRRIVGTAQESISWGRVLVVPWLLSRGRGQAKSDGMYHLSVCPYLLRHVV